MNVSDVVDVLITDIKLEGSNVRSDLDSNNSQEGLAELAENIKINGLLQPIVLRGEKNKPPYDIIVGQRRFLAHLKLGKTSIKATFSGIVDDTTALLLSLSENMCRQEMNFIDTSKAITKLYNHFDKDEYKVKEHTGFSIKMIRSYIAIEAQATNKIKQLISRGDVSMQDAKRAIQASQGDTQKADILIDELTSLTKYEKKRLVEQAVKTPTAAVSDLIQSARTPRLEESIILTLPRKIHKALSTASEKLSIEMEELTVNALVHWLKTNDFLID